MGRIADALKRAQDERNRRRDGSPVGVAEPPSPEKDASSLRETARSSEEANDQADEVLDRIVLPSAPALSDHFPANTIPVDPDQINQDLVAFHEPTGQIAEKYRSVRTRLLTDNPSGRSRVLAVTSSIPKEGKTTSVGNLGFSMAELRHLRVAMLDLDFRQRGLSHRLQVHDRPGIAEVLRGERRLADVVIPVVRSNLHVVPAGNTAGASPSELISGEPALRLFKELNERYHYSLIDTPPMGAAADIGLIAPLCHAVIMVIRMNRAPESVLRRSVKMLQANHVKIGGCILTGYEESALGLGSSNHYYGDTDSD